MTVRTQRGPALLALPRHVAVFGALVAHPEVVVCAVVRDLAPFVARALGGAVAEDALWHGLEGKVGFWRGLEQELD